MRSVATKKEKPLAVWATLLSVVVLLAGAAMPSHASATTPSYPETRDRVSSTLQPARGQLESELSPDLQQGYEQRSGWEAVGSLDAPGRGAINPALEQRLAAYKAWKVRAGIEDTPTTAQFRRFMGAHRPGSRGVTLYPNRSGFARWSRSVNRTHRHHGFPQQYREDFADIGIAVDDFVFDLPARHHLSQVHHGSAGGVYNTFWEGFFAGRHGPITRENALSLLARLRERNFLVP